MRFGAFLAHKFRRSEVAPKKVNLDAGCGGSPEGEREFGVFHHRPQWQPPGKYYFLERAIAPPSRARAGFG